MIEESNFIPEQDRAKICCSDEANSVVVGISETQDEVGVPQNSRVRGKNRKWTLVKNFSSVEEALLYYSSDNLKKKGYVCSI